MSIKISCDQHKNSSFSISLSPRRDVAKKRLRLTTLTDSIAPTKNLSTQQHSIYQHPPPPLLQQHQQLSHNSIFTNSNTIAQNNSYNNNNKSETAVNNELKYSLLSPLYSSATYSSQSSSALATNDVNVTTQQHCSNKLQQASVDLKEINNNNKYSNLKSNNNNNNNNNNIKLNNKLTIIKNKLKNFYLGKYCIFHIVLLILFNQISCVRPSNALLIVDPTTLDDGFNLEQQQQQQNSNTNTNDNAAGATLLGSNISIGGGSNNDDGTISDPIVIGGGGGGGHYLDKLDNLERSVAAVLMKVAYGTTSTTKRSIPDNSYVPSLTTIATPPLTTLRYSEKSPNQQQINLHHRNYELDLERDHALPTSAPNADILKSNSNPTYPNPNRHHNHDRDRHRHLLNSTPAPSIHNLLKKGQPTIPMYPGDMPSYSPPARSFFTPPLPPEYQNPFADKPTLRGTNNDGGIITPGGNTNQQSYINRRPIPPPSLMPGHERIPFRPPDLNQPGGSNIGSPTLSNTNQPTSGSELTSGSRGVTVNGNNQGLLSSNKPLEENQQQRKKALNTPSQKVNNKIDSTYDVSSIPAINQPNSNIDTNININGDRVPNISRILSGSNGKKEDIPDVLLKQVTNRPLASESIKNNNDGNNNNNDNNNNPGGSNINQSKLNRGDDIIGINNFDTNTGSSHDTILDDSDEDDDDDDDDFDDVFQNGGGGLNIKDQDEPKTQLTIKINGKSTENPHNGHGTSSNVYSTQIIHNLANEKKNSQLTTSTPNNNLDGHQAAAANAAITKDTTKINIGTSTTTAQSNAAATWDIAWNIHVYLSVILFTILGVYSIFKMIFYNKLTHLFNQSYFIWIHLILISICVARIFYLIYDAYNIHSSFPIFISELLLNLPATFLTISFSVLILFLLIRSLNHKTNRYSALIRPLTVLVGSLVHVFLCITLHLVESYTATQNSHLHYYYQQQQQQQQQHQQRNIIQTSGSIRNINHNGIPITIPPPPPRVLSLICQIIYIFVCLSLGLLYLYIYRILKRVLRSKSQNYIHGYQNLSYAIHITIATALLFVLLAALQIFGAISISTTRTINMTTGGSEIDWLQWGYQFSLRLIEIAIIWLMSWVAGLKTGGTSSVLQREKQIGGGGNNGGNGSNNSNHDNHHNVSGFALFPCTSSSSQEHFETDYPAVCNANTNLHTYTLRTGKPIYDDNFALNSLQSSGGVGINNGQIGNTSSRLNDFHQLQQQQQSANTHQDFVRSYETSSLRSGNHSGGSMIGNHHDQIIDSDFLGGINGANSINNDSTTDHYENPNFELRGSKSHYSTGGHNMDSCYSEPLNPINSNIQTNNINRLNPYDHGYDFQNFERPNFQQEQRPHSRNNQDYQSGGGVSGVPGTSIINHKQKHSSTKLDRSSYENPERRSSNSTHSCTSTRGHYGTNNNPDNINQRGYSQYNSFDRRNCGVRKSGTLNNIGGNVGIGNNAIINGQNPNIIHGRNGSSSSSTSSHSHHRPSGVQTLSSTHRGGGNNASGRINQKNNNSNFYRGNNSRSSLERINSGINNVVTGIVNIQTTGLHNNQQQYILPSDDEMLLVGNSQAERTNLINGHCSGNSSGNDVTGGITSSTSGGNLTDITTNGLITNDIIQHANNGISSINTNAGGGGNNGGGSSSISGESANSGSMLVAEHGFVRFRALDDINNAQGVGIHNASIRTTGRCKEKRYTNNT